MWLAASLVVGCSGDGGGGGGGGGGNGGGNGGGGNGTTGDGPALSIDAQQAVANDTGYVLVEVEVEDGDASFQVTGETSPADRVSLVDITDPDGREVVHWSDWWDSPQSLMNGFFGYDPVTAVQWPVREEDGPLTPGTWRVRLSATDPNLRPRPRADMEVTTMVKADGDLAQGDVLVQIVYADGVDDDPDVVAGVEAAVERWREVWGVYGLRLNESYTTSSLDPDLQFTYVGDDTIATLPKDEGALRLIVGERIAGERYTYGISAGIPGTAVDSRSTYVVVAWLVHAGVDAAFDEGETSLMGETMAHEVGHYMGLYHPVESSYSYWDALGDTVECRNANSCETQLGTNLMFPYSICDNSGCVAAEDMTAGQVGVKQRYISTL